MNLQKPVPARTLLSRSLLAAALLAGALGSRAYDVLLQADYDRGSASASVAKGDPNPIPGTTGQPVPAPGIGGQSAEVSAPGRQLAYHAPGNIDLNQGTLIVWLQPLDWDQGTEGFTPLLSIGAEKGYAIHYFLYYHHFPGGDRNLDFRARIEGRELCITEREVVPKNPAVLGRGEWTQIGLTWSGNQFALFVNGEKVGKQTYGLPVSRGLPGPNDAIWLLPNPFWKEQPGPVRTTRVDELSVLARPLTPAEIRARFRQFRSVVANRHQPAATPVPRSDVTVRLDGQLDAAEWADASRVALMKKLDGGRLTSLRAWCSLKYDPQNLLLGFEVETPHEVSCQGTGRDAAVFGGDEAEVILRPPWTPTGAYQTPADVFYQFAVNPAGAYAARRAQGASLQPEIWAWKTGYQCAARRSATGWTAEMRIPFADLGGVPEPGTPWLAELGLHRPLAETLGGDYERWLAWSATKVGERSGFDDPANMGLLHFQPAGLAVRLEQFGDLTSGQAALGLAVLGGPALRAALTVTGEKADVGSWSWDAGPATAAPTFALPPPGEGFFDLCLSAGAAASPIYRLNTALWIKQPLALSTKSHAESGELAVRVDLSGAQDEALARSLRERSASLVLTLTARGAAKPWASADFTPTAADEEFRLKLGDLPVGLYDLTAKVTGGSVPLATQVPFERPDPAFLTAAAGVDRSIPAPWVPIKVDGTTVTVVNRTYVFSGQPFPAAATSEGQPVLARPVTLAVEREGKVLAFPPGLEQAVEVAPDRLVSTGTSTLPDGSLRLDWRRTVDYDGLVTCEFSLVPATAGSKVRVEAFWLEAAAPLAAARFVFPYNPDWPKLGKVAARRDWAWVTNDRVGLCWFTDRDANWVWADATSPVGIVRRDNEAVIRAQIIGKPVDINGPTPYVMGLTATPTRPLRPDWRRIHAEGWRAPRGETLQSVCWMDVEGIQFTNRWLLGDLVEPEKGLKELAEYKALGIDCVPYACGSAMPTNNPIYDFYESQWEITSNGRPAPKDYRTLWRGREFYIGGVCPASGFADWMVSATRNYMTKYPFAGLYLDYGCPSACDNPRHGCGGTDVFGQPRGSFGILAKRAMYQRLYKVIHGIRPEGYLWTHNWLAFCPPLHSFTDLDFPGEEFMHTAPRNPNVYSDQVTPEEWQCNYNSHIRGVGIQFLSMVANSLEEMRDDARRSRPMLTSLLLHDVPCNGNRVHWETISRVWKALDTNNVTAASFTGYWNPEAPVKSSEPRARVSTYTWAGEKRLLLVVGNLTAEALTARLDLGALIPAGATPSATNEETGETVDLQQPISLTDRDFRLLRVLW
jgi:hypothetical protein